MYKTHQPLLFMKSLNLPYHIWNDILMYINNKGSIALTETEMNVVPTSLGNDSQNNIICTLDTLVLSVHPYKSTVRVWCLWRPKEDIDSQGNGVLIIRCCMGDRK